MTFKEWCEENPADFSGAPDLRNLLKCAYDAGYVEHQSQQIKGATKAGFEIAILNYGVRKACEYFNHPKDGGFANGLVVELEE